MGWFSSVKKEENVLPQVSSLQQVNPMGVQSHYTPSLNVPSEVSSTVQEIGTNGHMNKAEPFFVRMDKFNDAKRVLMEVERKMKDMEEVLARLGEAKQKEDEEIDSWKQNLKDVKGYLEDIHESVFNRL